MGLARKLLTLRKFHARPPLHADRAIRYTICGLLALGFVLAAWRLWATLYGPVDVDSMSQRTAVIVPDTVSEDNIAAMHLFGAESPAVLQPAVRIDAFVAGIVYASEAQVSRAILVVNSTAQSYAVGSTLPGGTRVVSIEQNQVVLDQNGERYALMLEHRLADQNADFGSLWSPVAAASPVYPRTQVATAGAGGNGGTRGLEVRRQNLAVPPDVLAGKQGQGTRTRAMHRGKISPKSD